MRKIINTKTKNGITLIALVISIIILLILARSNTKCSFKWKWHNKSCTNCSRLARKGAITGKIRQYKIRCRDESH